MPPPEADREGAGGRLIYEHDRDVVCGRRRRETETGAQSEMWEGKRETTETESRDRSHGRREPYAETTQYTETETEWYIYRRRETEDRRCMLRDAGTRDRRARDTRERILRERSGAAEE